MVNNYFAKMDSNHDESSLMTEAKKKSKTDRL